MFALWCNVMKEIQCIYKRDWQPCQRERERERELEGYNWLSPFDRGLLYCTHNVQFDRNIIEDLLTRYYALLIDNSPIVFVQIWICVIMSCLMICLLYFVLFLSFSYFHKFFRYKLLLLFFKYTSTIILLEKSIRDAK